MSNRYVKQTGSRNTADIQLIKRKKIRLQIAESSSAVSYEVIAS